MDDMSGSETISDGGTQVDRDLKRVQTKEVWLVWIHSFVML